MSMTMLTILQIAQALSAYTLVTLILPGIMLHKHLAEYKMSERLIGYFLAGNFYIIYLVFLLQFLHISYPITLQIGTIFPAFFIIWKKRKSIHIISKVSDFFQMTIHILRKEIGLKTLISKGWKKFNHKTVAKALPSRYFTHSSDYSRCILCLWNKYGYRLWI